MSERPSTDAPAGRVVHVEIHGQRYPIRSSLDATYVAELAAYVDEKMRMAAKECTAGDTLKVAVLAALNIADEYFSACGEVRARQAGLAHRAGELERMLDVVLADGQAWEAPAPGSTAAARLK
ncbi:MAG TPA: cell division protein ZapA [Vicinamibacterales bacterium]|nr:cell division protein ZapA [Vicinamibacterales bacterium]